MSLLARTRLLAALIVGATLLLTFAFLDAHERLKQAREASEYLSRLWVDVAKLRMVGFDYVLQGQERARHQAERQFDSLRNQMSEAWIAGAVVTEHPEEERELRRQLRRVVADTEAAFEELVSSKGGPAQAERERRNGERFVLKTQEIIGAITALNAIQFDVKARAHRNADRYALVLASLLTAMALLAVFLLERHVLRPLEKLRRAAAAIGHGDTNVRLHSPRKDEIGALANAFDATLERLEAANKELESFAYSVSHDLRAPLRAVDGFSLKVLNRYGGKLDDEGRRLLGVIRDQAVRMGQLIDDLLAFSRMGRREMSSELIDMDAMVRNVAAEAGSGEAGRSIDLRIANLPAAQGDPAMLRQVWSNLIGNAVKFSRHRPITEIEIGGRPEGREIVFWVQDNGAGFDMKYADKLFGVFQRLHRQDEFEGTGVGLAIAQRILHRHGGRIWGEAKPDAGAIFRFALPQAATTAKSPQGATP